MKSLSVCILSTALAFSSFASAHASQSKAHGAAIALGVWGEGSSYSVTEVDYGLYTPTFSVVLSNEVWAQISDEDQAAIKAISGEALARKSAAWDDFDNSFRSRMMELGLDHRKADQALMDELFLNSLGGLQSWITTANASGLAGNDAVNFYFENLRSLEDRLIYRAQGTSLDDHPFIKGTF